MLNLSGILLFAHDFEVTALAMTYNNKLALFFFDKDEAGTFFHSLLHDLTIFRGIITFFPRGS
jgi:hypothetical protein